MPVILFESEPPIPSGAGLTSSECYELAIAARCLPGDWDVQWDKDDRGHLSLALLQDDDGVVGAAGVFLIWREDGQLRLGFGQDDTYTSLGAHVATDGIMRTIRGRLEGVADQARARTADRSCA